MDYQDVNFEKMELNDMIQFKAHFDKHLDAKLLEMDHFFTNYMWDGYTEDIGQFVSDEDFEAIQALTDKIKHMIINIGCPLSVGEMLVSICDRKIKYWQIDGDNKGKQLKNKADRVRASNEWYYESDKGKMVVKGHFRWNNRGYMLSRVATDVLRAYITNNGF